MLGGMKIPAEPKVILRSCRDYDPERIRTIIREGLEELGLRPFGRTLVKPNLVAAGPLFPHAYTRPEFVEGVLRALRDVGGASMTELAVGERCGITVPTRVAFARVGLGRDAQEASTSSATTSRRSRRSRSRSRTRAGCATTCSRPSRSRAPTSS